MDDQAAADDRVRAVEAEYVVIQVEGGVAVGIGLDVAQVADVPLRFRGPGVRLPWWG